MGRGDGEKSSPGMYVLFGQERGEGEGVLGFANLAGGYVGGVGLARGEVGLGTVE